MNWYYAAGGRQQGPVDDAQLDAMLQSGQVNQDTLLWRDGMANWQPLRQARPSADAPPFVAPAADAGASAGVGEIVCTECGKIFSKDSAIQYGTAWVCAACKPIFLQKLREGATTGSGLLGAAGMRYAGFWIRVAAKFIDHIVMGIVLGIPMLILVFTTGMISQQGGQPNFAAIGLQIILQVAGLGFGVAYNTFMHGKYGATLGKMAVGIRVVMADGAPITFMRAFGRAWADILSSMICYIGYIIAGFDAEKRSLHDHICQTRVIYK